MTIVIIIIITTTIITGTYPSKHVRACGSCQGICDVFGYGGFPSLVQVGAETGTI
jgi:hypothetical protein